MYLTYRFEERICCDSNPFQALVCLAQFLDMSPRLHLLREHGRCIHHILIQTVASIFVRYDPLDSRLRCHIYHTVLRALCHEMKCKYYYILAIERVLQEVGVGVLTFMDGNGGRESSGRVGSSYH